MNFSIVRGSSTPLLIAVAIATAGVVKPAGASTVVAAPQQKGSGVECQETKERAAMPADGVKKRVPPYRVEGNGRLLIYIAGLDGTGELFFKQAPALARSYRVVTFRARDDARFTYEDLADDVAAIIE